MTDVVKILRGLHDAATKGPWHLAIPSCGADDYEAVYSYSNIESGSVDIAADVLDANAILIATLRTLLPELIADQAASARLASAADALAATDGEAFSHMATQAEFDAALDAWKDARRALATAAAAVEKEVRGG